MASLARLLVGARVTRSCSSSNSGCLLWRRRHAPIVLGAPVFAMFEGAKLLTTVHSQDFVRWPTVRAIWKAVLEQLCLEESSDTVLTNMVFPKALPQLPDGSSTWTQEFKRAVLEAIDAWNLEP